VFASRQQRVGVLYALAAFGFWGLVPVYFKAVGHVAPLDVLAHRVVWSAALTALLVTAGREWGELPRAMGSGRVLGTLALTALLVSGNWLTFIYAVQTGRVLEASLGYFINPLVNVVLGVIFLRERLRPRQILAVLLAAAGTLNLTLSLGTLPWIALVLALSFGFYGLLRKTVHIGALNGLFAETALLLPAALAYLVYLDTRGQGAFGRIDWQTTGLLVLAGAVTALPLVWFTAAARRLRYSTIGLFQYLAPSLHFLLAVAVYREPFTRTHLLTFTLIWAGLALYLSDTLASRRRELAARAGSSG
jgi:chloramphenicol-sensitive protein RarD